MIYCINMEMQKKDLTKNLIIYFNFTIRRDTEGFFKENYIFYLTENH